MFFSVDYYKSRMQETQDALHDVEKCYENMRQHSVQIGNMMDEFEDRTPLQDRFKDVKYLRDTLAKCMEQLIFLKDLLQYRIDEAEEEYKVKLKEQPEKQDTITIRRRLRS